MCLYALSPASESVLVYSFVRLGKYLYRKTDTIDTIVRSFINSVLNIVYCLRQVRCAFVRIFLLLLLVSYFVFLFSDPLQGSRQPLTLARD